MALARSHDHRTRRGGHAAAVIEAVEAERRRIARELHDEFGQVLTCLKLTLERAERPRQEQAGADLAEALDLVHELMTRVHDRSFSLAPSIVDDLGLLPALVGLANGFSSRGVTVRIEHDGVDRRFPADVEIAAFRIAQEAVTNSVRHSGASEICVRCRASEDLLRLEVGDEGIGFDPVRRVATRAGGLAGMMDRARLVGGRLEIRARPGRGVLVLCELPLSRGSGRAPWA